jgi:hypothetical protein
MDKDLRIDSKNHSLESKTQKLLRIIRGLKGGQSITVYSFDTMRSIVNLARYNSIKISRRKLSQGWRIFKISDQKQTETESNEQQKDT